MSDAQDKVQPESGSPSKKISPVHRRSLHIHLLSWGALILFGVWGIARLAVCWGTYGAAGHFGCHHSHWAPVLVLLGAAGFLALLVYELSELAIQEFEGKRFRRSRALLRGYRSLKWGEQVNSAVATFFVIAFLLGLGYLVFFSSLMF